MWYSLSLRNTHYSALWGARGQSFLSKPLIHPLESKFKSLLLLQRQGQGWFGHGKHRAWHITAAQWTHIGLHTLLSTLSASWLFSVLTSLWTSALEDAHVAAHKADTLQPHSLHRVPSAAPHLCWHMTCEGHCFIKAPSRRESDLSFICSRAKGPEEWTNILDPTTVYPLLSKGSHYAIHFYERPAVSMVMAFFHKSKKSPSDFFQLPKQVLM